MSGKAELLPCPFCGSGPARSPGRYTQASFSGVEIIRDWREPPTYSVQCGTCGASGSPERTEVEAAAAWNTRHDPHPTPDDLANKCERDLAYAWECADRLAEALALIALTTMSTFKNPTHMAQVQKQWASDALAAYRKDRGR